MTVKELERYKKNLDVKLKKLLDGGQVKDTSLNFEQYGFDYLVIDEAHNYKNGLVVSRMRNVAGVATRPANKSEDILMKCNYLNSKYGCNRILTATGTPVTNSMTELYVLQNYLRPDLLQSMQLMNFDDWASNYGEVVSQLELKPAGDGFRMKSRFCKFNNLPELMSMFKEFADVQNAEDLDLPVPNLLGGEPQVVVAKPSEFQLMYMKVLAERSKKMQQGGVDPRVDNMLRVTHEARLLGLDGRTIDPSIEADPNGKVALCVENVIEIYNQTTEQRGVQAIFCDVAVNSADGNFSVYDAIKSDLIERGIPADEICFASDAKDDKQRNKLFEELRNGDKRIAIASTSKLGTGANIQTRLAALHHLDIPWRPADLDTPKCRVYDLHIYPKSNAEHIFWRIINSR